MSLTAYNSRFRSPRPVRSTSLLSPVPRQVCVDMYVACDPIMPVPPKRRVYASLLPRKPSEMGARRFQCRAIYFQCIQSCTIPNPPSFHLFLHSFQRLTRPKLRHQQLHLRHQFGNAKRLGHNIVLQTNKSAQAPRPKEYKRNIVKNSHSPCPPRSHSPHAHSSRSH